MALSDEQISRIWDEHTVPVFGKTGINPIVFARAIEAEVRKQDTALIQKLVKALKKDRHDIDDWPEDSRNAAAALRARLEGKP